MSTSFPTIRDDTGGWINLVALNGSLSAATLTLQNKGSGDVQIVFGGTIPTSDDAGVNIKPNEAVNGSGTAIWAKSIRGFSIAPLEND